MNWTSPPSTFSARPDELHIWRFSLEQPVGYREKVWPWLAADEQARAQRFVFDKDRLAYINARGTLRLLLSRYLDRPPQALRFSYNQYNKPDICAEQNKQGVSFNLSHSGRIGLIAVTQQHLVGVDVEQHRPDVATDDMSKFTFSQREYEAWRALPKMRQTEGFFTCWTRKEAFIKAHGWGLSLDLKTFDVALHPDDAAELLAYRPAPAEVEEWRLQDIPIDAGYSAAVAMKARPWEMRLWEWSGET